MGFRFVCQLRLLAFSSFQSPGSTLTEFTVRLGENPEEGLRFGTTVGLQLVRDCPAAAAAGATVATSGRVSD